LRWRRWVARRGAFGLGQAGTAAGRSRRADRSLTLALFEVHVLQLSADLRGDGDDMQRRYRAEGVEHDLDVAGFRLGSTHRQASAGSACPPRARRRGRRGRLLRGAVREPPGDRRNDPANADDHERQSFLLEGLYAKLRVFGSMLMALLFWGSGNCARLAGACAKRSRNGQLPALRRYRNLAGDPSLACRAFNRGYWSVNAGKRE
jgi:hypothetical protein